jgi:hypothetical protein
MPVNGVDRIRADGTAAATNAWCSSAGIEWSVGNALATLRASEKEDSGRSVIPTMPPVEAAVDVPRYAATVTPLRNTCVSWYWRCRYRRSAPA